MAFDHSRTPISPVPVPAPLLQSDSNFVDWEARIGCRLFFSANTQHENAGDALINRELISLLRPFGRLTIASAGAPDHFIAQLGLSPGELRYKSRVGLWLRAFLSGFSARLRGRQRPFLVLTPGDPGGVLDHNVLMRGLLMLALHGAGVRIIRLGVSLSRMSPGRVRFEALMSGIHTHIGVRDTQSLSIAQTFGFRNVDYFPDLAFRVPPLERLPRQADDRRLSVVFALRDDNLDPAKKGELIAYLDQFVGSLKGRFVPCITFVAQVQADARFMRELACRYGPAEAMSIIEEQDLAHLQRIYARTDIIVSNRLHALLYGAAQGAVPLALLLPGANAKIASLFGDVGLAEHAIDVTKGEGGDVELLLQRRHAVIDVFRRSSHIIDEKIDAVFTEREP
jgi:hypothetical protein